MEEKTHDDPRRSRTQGMALSFLAGWNVWPVRCPARRMIPMPGTPARYACRYFREGLDSAAAPHDLVLRMSIETRTKTMATRYPTETRRGSNRMVRAWRMVTSFFAIAARSLPAAGI